MSLARKAALSTSGAFAAMMRACLLFVFGKLHEQLIWRLCVCRLVVYLEFLCVCARVEAAFLVACKCQNVQRKLSR